VTNKIILFFGVIIGTTGIILMGNGVVNYNILCAVIGLITMVTGMTIFIHEGAGLRDR